MKPEKIDDKIYLLKGTRSSNIYYFDFDKKAIIDTGHQSEFLRIQKAFKKIKINITKIDYILNTHSHGDHVGSNSIFKEINPDIKIIGSAKTETYQANRQKIELLKGAEDVYDKYKIDIFVKDQDIIDLGGCILKVIETPGHSPDSISFYLEEKSWLFSGDLIYSKVVTQLDYYQDLLKSLHEAIDSYNKVKALNCAALYTGHSDQIINVNENLDIVLRKMYRFEKQPEMIIINTFIPSIEFYIYKNKGCTSENIKDFFIQNMSKFNNQTIYIGMTNEKYKALVDKMLSLMMLMKMIKQKNERFYLTSSVNQYISMKKN